jgi:hypothetical protein
VKSSLGEQQSSLRLTVEPLTVESEQIETARVVSRGTVQLTAADLLIAAPEPGSAIAEATQLLKTELGDGPKTAKALFGAADDIGVSRETLKRAKKRLGIESVKLAFAGGWAWKLPVSEESPRRNEPHSGRGPRSSDAGLARDPPRTPPRRDLRAPPAPRA